MSEQRLLSAGRLHRIRTGATISSRLEVQLLDHIAAREEQIAAALREVEHMIHEPICAIITPLAKCDCARARLIAILKGEKR